MVFLILLLCVYKKLHISYALPIFVLSSEAPSTAVNQRGGMATSARLQPACLCSSPGLFTFFCSIVHLNIKMGLVLVQDF